MTLAALDALGADPTTELIAVIGKPGAPAVRRTVEAKLRAIGKPAVVAILDRGVQTGHDDGITTVTTLEDACRALALGSRWSPRAFTVPPDEVRARVEAARRDLDGGRAAIRGLYAGGTLAHEAALILEAWLGPVESNMAPHSPAEPAAHAPSPHRILDLGADEYTRARAHPMIDPTVRIEAIAAAARDGDVGVLLLDVVLGLGAAADPAGDLAPALEAARGRGRPLAIVLSVVGTPADPQGLAAQITRLERAGAWVLPSNAQAARAAACIASPDRVLPALLGERRP